MIERSLAGFLGRIAVLVAVGASLQGVRHVLPPPPVLSAQGVEVWWSQLGPVTATFSLGRLALLCLVSVWGLALVVVFAVAATMRSARAGPRCAQSVLAWSAVRPWRRLLLFALGLSVSTGALAACSGTGTGDRATGAGQVASPQAPVLSGPGVVRAEAPAVGAWSGRTAGLQAGRAPYAPAKATPATAPPVEDTRAKAPPATATPVKEPQGKAQPAPGTLATDPRAGRSSAAPARPAPLSPARPQLVGGDDPAPAGTTVGWGTWKVGPGDDFWSIAEAVVARSPDGPAPSVGRYWAALLSANRDRLPVPGDPNLLFPGDRILLPPLGGGTG